MLLNRYETLPKSNILGISFLCFVLFFFCFCFSIHLLESLSECAEWYWLVQNSINYAIVSYICVCFFFFIHFHIEDILVLLEFCFVCCWCGCLHAPCFFLFVSLNKLCVFVFVIECMFACDCEFLFDAYIPLVYNRFLLEWCTNFTNDKFTCDVLLFCYPFSGFFLLKIVLLLSHLLRFEQTFDLFGYILLFEVQSSASFNLWQ